MNKYGGINDFPLCDKKVYRLWYQMLRRCYDEKQKERSKGKCYQGCSVSNEWMVLSHFANDITKIRGYEHWVSGEKYCLDKDILNPGNRVYSMENCQFVPSDENVRDIYKRNPLVTKNANEAHRKMYFLQKDGQTLTFESEKDACKYLGVAKCSVSSCYHKGYKCKGYTISTAKMDGGGNDATPD